MCHVTCLNCFARVSASDLLQYAADSVSPDLQRGWHSCAMTISCNLATAKCVLASVFFSHTWDCVSIHAAVHITLLLLSSIAELELVQHALVVSVMLGYVAPSAYVAALYATELCRCGEM